MIMRWRELLAASFSILLLSFSLAWISSGFESLQGWLSFLLVILFGVGCIFGCWVVLKKTEQSIPHWVLSLLLGAALLRLIVGAFWFIALPLWGYGGEVESAGYVMSDAFKRDTVAWELSQSEQSLFDAFDGYRSVDQYGGLLFFSAAIYRYLGGAAHMPLMLVVLTASFSALAVLFTWVFSRRIWGKDVAKIAAWSLAFYPEALLLGSSQMREAFTVSFTIIALYGLVLIWQQLPKIGVAYIFLALTLSMPLSPTFTFMLIGVLGIVVLSLGKGERIINWRVLAGLGILIGVGLLGIFLFGDDIMPESGANILVSIQEWIKNTVRWQAFISSNISGWMHKIFTNTPENMHALILVAYGAVQPFLPAAIFAKGKPIWWGIAIVRALGWTSLLLLLVYAPIRALRKTNRSVALGASIAVWAVIIITALLGGGDQWDNPRYRAAFAGLQIALAAWVWVEQRRDPDPWLRRVFIGVGFVFLWFFPWYIRRYFPGFTWPVVNLFKTFGLGLASAVLFAVWDWAQSQHQA